MSNFTVDEIEFRTVYELLQDEESKDIFLERHKYNQDDEYIHFSAIAQRWAPQLVEKYGLYYPGKEELILDKIKDRDVIIFGAGTRGKKLLNMCRSQQINVVGVCDNYVRAGGGTRRGNYIAEKSFGES